MPITNPTLDNRRYQDLLDEALARIPIHNPEWTNFNQSDPGVTLIQVFAFLAENLLYRSNQIPERNRRKFLSLLGVPLQPASSAIGLVAFQNERGPLETMTLNQDLQVDAGQVPFRTAAGLDVLPVEAQVFYKSELTDVPDAIREHYAQLYASWRGTPPADPNKLRLYETRPLVTRQTGGVDLSKETMDNSLWIALLVRANDKPYAQTIDNAREAIGGKTLNLGLAPYYDQPEGVLAPGATQAEGLNLLEYQIPKIPPNGLLPKNEIDRLPVYQTLSTSQVPTEPDVIQITLPSKDQLTLWKNFDPLESGVGDFPPNLEDTSLNERVITWLRVVAPPSVQFKVMWAGINATFVSQRARVANELLPAGTGEPDQIVTLSKAPVLPDTFQLMVTPPAGQEEAWQAIDDLFAAGPEVPTPDLRRSPSLAPQINRVINVFALDPEAGTLRFGDGTHGRRPPREAVLRATYDYGVGRAGNVGVDAIKNGPALPVGLKVTNPIRTWGGAEAETVIEGEKQIAGYLQNRDRLVSTVDFKKITLRTPGVDLGRVEVLPIFNPKLSTGQAGNAPGAVTLLLVPKYDNLHPDTPEPDQVFLNAVCAHLDPRRLVTTEVFLRGPVYKPVWLSVGFKPAAGAAVATVREAIKQALIDFLSPLPNPGNADPENGWPLEKGVVDRELMAVASRVRDVQLIKDVLIAEGDKPASEEISITGLELPRIAGISVVLGDPLPVDQLRGGPTTTTGTDLSLFKPVPFIPEECSVEQPGG